MWGGDGGGGVNGKKNKQGRPTSDPGLTQCGFFKTADFDVNMYLWFYSSEQEPPLWHTKTIHNYVSEENA